MGNMPACLPGGGRLTFARSRVVLLLLQKRINYTACSYAIDWLLNGGFTLPEGTSPASGGLPLAAQRAFRPE
jgi:hypothetical protein